MSFQDVSSFSTSFINNCGRDESLGIMTCLKTVVGGRQGHAPCRVFMLHKASLLCQLNFMEIIKLLTKMR